MARLQTKKFQQSFNQCSFLELFISLKDFIKMEMDFYNGKREREKKRTLVLIGPIHHYYDMVRKESKAVPKCVSISQDQSLSGLFNLLPLKN